MPKAKPKILIIGTGGTIGAKKVDGAWKYGELAEEELIEIIAGIKDKFNITTANIFRMDSAEMTPQHWQTIANSIYYGMKGYDGIVVTIGTDTMSYCAAAISFLIQNQNIPIVLTGAQIESGEITTDARLNLKNALTVAGHSDLAETVITFNGKIIRGTRARKVNASDFDGFDSFGEPELGSIEYAPKFYLPYNKRKNSKPMLYKNLETQIALLKVYPGFNGNAIKELVDKGMRGIVIEGYGLGLVPIQNTTTKEALLYAREKNVPVILTSSCSLGTNWHYIYDAETKGRVNEFQAIPAYDMITETAYVKLMWVLGQTREYDEVKKMMQKSYAGEITELKKTKKESGKK